MTPHSGQRGRNRSIARLRATLPIGKPTPSEHTAATVPPKVTERMQIEHKPEATKHAPEPKQSLFPAPSPSRCFHTQVRAADGPQPVRTSKERGTKRALPGGRQLIAVNRIHVLKARLLSLIGTESSRSRFGARRSAPRALEARRTRGAARGRGRSPGSFVPRTGGAPTGPSRRHRSSGQRTPRGAGRTGRGRSEQPRGPSFVLPRRHGARPGQAGAPPPLAARAQHGAAVGFSPLQDGSPPPQPASPPSFSPPFSEPLPASLAPPSPRDAAPLTRRQARTGSRATAAAAAPPGAAVPRCAAPRREGTIGAGSARLGSAVLGAGRGLEWAWLRHRTAVGGACGRRSARACRRRAAQRACVLLAGGGPRCR